MIMRNRLYKLLLLLVLAFTVMPFGSTMDTVNAEVVNEGWDETGTVYYVKKSGKLVKASGVVKAGEEYLYFEDGVVQSTFTALKTFKDEDDFEVYYIENGKALCNSWKTAADKKGEFKFYFGSDGKAYKAERFAGMKTTKVILKTVEGAKYGFDENGHCVTGLWATDNKLVFFNKKTGVYDAKASKKYQKAVKRKKTSKDMPKKLKKVFGKPTKIKSSNSCNPFDIKPGAYFDSAMLKNYRGYNYYYKNIMISMTKNKKTGVYYMDGAGPIDLN